ncbi:MAG: EamA family transporter [Clostridia bacterium]|nr:EamA family transporter [Clostridia bacterium]
MQYYLLVSAATVLFALQFLFNQKFEQERGNTLKSALEFTLYKSIVIVVMMLIISRFDITITPFSVILAVIYAVACILMTYFSMKAFAVANLSVYSVFSMLGGMLLPFLAGVGFYNEELTAFKIICCLLIVVSVLLNLRGGKQSKKAFLYYMAVFILNGSVGVISKVHQSSSLPHTDSTGFMLLTSAVSIIISAVWLLIQHKKIPVIKGKSLGFAAGYGIFNGVGNWLLLISLVNLPASVQYPLVTGGVMVFSTIISMIRKEKLSVNDYIAAAISFVASVLMAF